MPLPMATQWLLECLQQPDQENWYASLTHLTAEQWEAVIEQADTHGLTPLLSHRLKQVQELWLTIPAYLQERLQQRYLGSAYRNLRLYQYFLTLLRTLNQSNVPVIVLKGVYLAYSLYEDRALRPMTDIDMLVKQGDVAETERVLQTLGYTLRDWKNHTWCLRNHYHLSYQQPEAQVNIEVHWHIQRPKAPYLVNIEELWQKAQPVTMAGAQAWALSYEHLVLYHCLHIAKHGFGVGLRPFFDLVVIMKKFGTQIDWSQVQAEAQTWRISKALYLSLFFIQEFFGTVPEALLDALKPTTLDLAIVLAAREQIFTLGSDVKRLSTDFLEVWEGETRHNKIGQLFRRIFLPPDLMSSLYGMEPDSWRVYLYYPVRLFDLLLRYPAVTHRLLRRDKTTLTLAQQATKVDSLRKWLAT